MGGGARGNFGNTKGSSLDALSDLLTAALLIPGIDTLSDLAAIPVNLLRGDFVSAGLDALGAIPFVGKIADTAKLSKMADKATDALKAGTKTKKVINKQIKGPPLNNRVQNKLAAFQKNLNCLLNNKESCMI